MMEDWMILLCYGTAAAGFAIGYGVGAVGMFAVYFLTEKNDSRGRG